MKMIQAIIRPEKADKTKKALKERGFAAMSMLEIPGGGGHKGIPFSRPGEPLEVDSLPRIMLMMVVSDHDVDTTVSIIRADGGKGNFGDEKIFVI